MDKRDAIKAVALDLDGTLVAADHHVSAKNQEAVQRAAGRGMTIIIASGRPFAGIRQVAGEIDLAGLGGYVVAANGGYVVDMAAKKEMVKRQVPCSVFRELDAFAGGFPEAVLLTYDETSMLVEDEGNPYARNIAETLRVPIKRVKPLLASLREPVSKLILAGEAPYLAGMAEPLQRQFSGRLACVYGGGAFIEVMPFGVTKAEGLKALLGELGLTAQNLMCCGDSPNDLQMMDLAGFSVAMQNASEEIKRRADYVTADCEEDGVAQAIGYLFGEC